MPVTCGLDSERRLSASSFAVRGAISEAVRELGFQITVDQLTRIEARRGGMIGYTLLMKKQMPVRAVFEVSTEASGCLVATHLTDSVKGFTKTWGVNRQYREIFDEVQRRVDLGLASLDGAASNAFEEPRFWSRAADIGVLEQTNSLTAKAVGGAFGAAGKVIDNPTDTTPRDWKGVDSVTFASSAGVAVLTLAETQADLGIAVLVVSHPGSMPANLSRDVETFAASVEQKLTAAGGHAAYVDISDAQKPVLEFLHQQAGIRSELPLRELHICRSCRLEKITNPQYQRIAARNEKIGNIVAGVGATIGKGGISPTFVLGQVFKFKRLDPEFVCSRCQGMEADERIVTFCPSCAELQRDVVLRLCRKCGFDFRTRAGKASLWSPALESETEPRTESENEPRTESAPRIDPGPAADPGPTAAVAPASEPAVDLAPGSMLEWAAGPESEPVSGSIGLPAPESKADPELELDTGDEPSTAEPDEPPTSPSTAPPFPIDDPAALWAFDAAGAIADQPVPPPALASAADRPGSPVPPPVLQPRVAPVVPPPVVPPTAAAVWRSPAEVPLGRPQVGRRGKVCQMCRREYPNLWRVVIATPAGFEERFLCGTTVTCQMRSLVTAVQV